MPDLHGWITQQIDEAQQRADRWHDTECEVHATTVIDAAVLHSATLCDCGGPAAVLCRCAADRKILEVHEPIGYACNGCGFDSENGYEVEHVNDCPTLLALAEGYGLTEEQREQLDRPAPEHPGWKPPVRLDALVRLMSAQPTSSAPAALRGPNWKATP